MTENRKPIDKPDLESVSGGITSGGATPAGIQHGSPGVPAPADPATPTLAPTDLDKKG